MHFYFIESCLFQDFIDVIGAERLEDVGQESQWQDLKQVTLEEISSAEIEAACHIHHQLFTSLTSAHWLTPEKITEAEAKCDLISPTLLAYQLGSEMIKQHYTVLGELIMTGND